MNHLKSFFKKRAIPLAIAAAIILSSTICVPIIHTMKVNAEQKKASTSNIATSSTSSKPTDELQKDLESLNSQIKSKPDSAELYLKRGAVYQKMKQYDNAIADYNKALSLDASLTNAHYLLAQIYTTKGDYTTAYDQLSTALKKDPENEDYLRLNADVCLTLSKYQENLDSIQKLLKKNPQDAVLNAVAGDTSVALLNYAAAANFYQHAIQNYNDETKKQGIVKADLYSAKANCNKTLQQYDQAISAYSESIKQSPTGASYFQRGFCYLQLAQYAKAIPDFTKAVSLKYEPDLSCFQRGLCYYSTQKFEEGLSDFQKYEKAYPDKNDSFLYSGLCCMNLKKYDEARSYFTKSINVGTSVGDCNFNIGNTFYNEEKFTEAIPYYTKAIELNAQKYTAMLNRGLCYVKTNKYNEAKADLKTVIDESNDPSLIQLAQKSYDPIKNITIVTNNNSK